MKILHIIFSFKTGGAELMLIDIVNIQCLTANVSLMIVNDEIDESLIEKINTEVDVIRIGRNRGSRSLMPIVKLNYCIFKGRFDIIHTHNENIIDIILLRRRKTIITLHDTRQSLSRLHQYAIVVAISNSVAHYIISNNCSVPMVIENGINVLSIRRKPDYSRRNSFRIVQVGRLEYETKGQDILLKALAIVKAMYEYDFFLDFIGMGSSEEYLKKLTKDLGLSNSVNFLGLKDRSFIYTHLADYDLFVQPSVYEGFGLTVAEAMAAGVPVLVSNIEGPMEIIEEGLFGNYFISGDVDDCAKKVLRIFNEYDDVCCLAKKGYEHILNNYSIETMVKKYFSVYENLNNSSQSLS